MAGEEMAGGPNSVEQSQVKRWGKSFADTGQELVVSEVQMSLEA